MWKSLHHPNVLPLLGATTGNRRFAMVSEWMDNGDIKEFVKKHRSANRFELVRSSSHQKLHPSLMVHPDSSKMSSEG